MNILVYDDQGASPNSVKHTVATLKQLLGHAYDILQVNATVLQSQPWEVNCAMLVMPGGRDLPYCHALNGEPNQRIKAYVSQGGRYLGLCAGAYYGSAEIEFEKDKAMDICEPRELGFFPGLSRGTAFPGFIYNSESGARSVTVKVYQLDGLPKEVKMYYNGGGYFVDPEKYDNVTVLCRFKERQDEEAAAVHCKIGKGHALLIATHPEYDISSSDLLLLDQASQTVTGIINDLIESEPDRKRLLRACFERIGLNVVPLISDNIVDENKIPDTTPVYIAGFSKEWIHQPVISLLHKADRRTKLVQDAADLFCITSLDDNKNHHVDLLSACRKREEKSDIVHLVYDEGISEPIHPPSLLTPFFDIATYFHELTQRRKEGVWKIGNGVLYGQVMTSTQSLLERNPKLLNALPSGFICTATHQTAGRGRGKNGWLSQLGALQFSLVLHHKFQLKHAPVVFIQYLMALAVVESITKRPGYEAVPLKLKWPNDIYLDTKTQGSVKVGGILVHSTFVIDTFMLVIGCGINLSNALPTVSINDVIAEEYGLQKLTNEDVLAGVLVKFEEIYKEFCENGAGPWFLNRYYDHWMHSDTEVILTTHDNERVRIVGITSDGLLKVKSLERNEKYYGLLPDNNSFDLMRGLLIQKNNI